MSNWNNARVTVQYTTGGGGGVRSINSVTVMVYGQSESAVLSKLRELYPHWRDITLLRVSWV